MTPAAPTAAELAADFLAGDRWRDPLQHLIFADYLDDRCGRPLDAAIQRVLVEPGEDRHRLDYADAVEADGRVAAWREATDRVHRLIVKGSSVFRSPAHDTEFERVRRAEAELRRTAEHAADRAEFIRVQVELARLGNDFVDYVAPNPEGHFRYEFEWQREVDRLTGRQRDLLEWASANNAPWWQGMPPRYSAPLFRRGFITEVTLTTADLLAHAGAVFACQPVERVVLSGRSPGDFGQAYNTVYGLRDRWRWYTSDDWHGQAGHLLRAELFGRLNGSGRWKNTYPTADAALADLSAAAVALGRDAAHLPPLPAGATGR